MPERDIFKFGYDGTGDTVMMVTAVVKEHLPCEVYLQIIARKVSSQSR
jgi:hypothetical protein